jgi:hypothetical protein
MADKKEPEVAEEEKKSQRQLEIERLRKTRIPPGVPSLNLDFPSREGYTRRVVADRPGRLEKFRAGAWSFVEKDSLPELDPGLLKAGAREGQDSRVSRVIGSHRDGSPMVGYLMEIPTELYDEDQALKAEKVDGLEASLRQGHDLEGGGRPGQDGRYVPSHTPIKIEQKGRTK